MVYGYNQYKILWPCRHNWLCCEFILFHYKQVTVVNVYYFTIIYADILKVDILNGEINKELITWLQEMPLVMLIQLYTGTYFYQVFSC